MVSPGDKARELIHGGNLPEALRLLEQNRGDEGLLVLLREWYIGERQNDRAMPLIQQLAHGHNAEAHVSRSIHALLGGDLRSAVQECQYALSIEPDLATIHNHLGRAFHNLGQAEQSLKAFQNAIRLAPEYPQAWQNLGHVMRATGRLDEAVKAYRQALELAPAYQGARLNLGITFTLQEDPQGALECFEPLLGEDPKHVEALVNSGLALHLLGRITEAKSRYDRAIEADPANATAWCYLGVLLNEQMDSEGAVNALEKALELDPGDIEARVELAGVYEQSNRLERARTEVDLGLNQDPYHPGLRLEHAKLERRDGNIGSAINTLRSIDPGRLQPRVAQQYHFELGQALDRQGEFEDAFAAFTASNELQARSPRRAVLDPEGFSRRVRGVRDWIARGAPGAVAPAAEFEGDTGSDLCFLFGFPRSGTTLLDTFLNAHPEVVSIEERPTLERVIDDLRAREQGYPDSLESLAGDEVAGLRALYREEASRYLVDDGHRLVLDKLPLRTLNAGLINRLFPDAKILFALRHPCDVVLSNFMQQYAENEAFIHFDTLADSAEMYDLVLGTWKAYEESLKLNVAYTRYEDLVDDPETELARLCEFLGLEPHPDMLDARARLAARGRVRTNSYQQVAEPVYRRSAGRWLNYRRHFDGVIDLLQPYLEQFGYGADRG